MKKLFILALALTALQVSAQDKNKGGDTKSQAKAKSVKVKKPQTVKTTSGLEYTITEKGDGKKPEIGDKVVVHYTGKLTNDTVFDSSKLHGGDPFTFKLGAGQVIKGWDEAFQLLHVGDKATIKFGPELGYGDRAMGKIPANSTLIFDVELLDIIEGVKPYDVKGKDTITTASGLKYIVVQPGKGEPSSAGTRVVANYSAYFKDGKMFDSSIDRGQPLKSTIGKGQLFAGLDEGIALMHKGEKARLIIPAKLAFGDKAAGPIPANSDLIFDIEIVDVQKIVAPVAYDIKGLEAKKTASGITYYEVKRSGSTVKAEAGKTVKVHYTGYLADGTQFDSSVERGEPIEFPLGAGRVIPGWEEGIALMNVGDKLRLVIPYFLAYGENGRPPQIPAKADLTFDVELIDVSNAMPGQ